MEKDLKQLTKEKLASTVNSLRRRFGKNDEQLAKKEDKIKEVKAELAERDSAERTLLVSAASGTSAAVVTAVANAGIRYAADRSAWLKQREGYALGVPHVFIGLIGAGATLASRPRGPASTGSEIAYRGFENFALFGLWQVFSTMGARRRMQQAQIQRALQNAAQIQAQAAAAAAQQQGNG